MIAKAIRPHRPTAVVNRGRRPMATSSQAGRKNNPKTMPSGKTASH